MTPEPHKRVLVADDDPEIRKILSAVLRMSALDVDEASDGREALELLNTHRYAVVLLDLMMPTINGFDVLEALQSDGPPVPPVVLVITGADREILDNLKLDSSRIHGIVRKPFDPHELASIVVACSEVRSKNAFGTMAIAVISSAPLLAWLHKL